nr:putative ribonuclease H-like domain-containing protein [Tanacetum cinerariifolium]
MIQVGISHETSVARSPQQNGVVERRNRTLIEAAHTMLIYAQAPLFPWAEAVATACFTQNQAIVVPDTEEILMLAEENRSKMIEKQNDPQMIDKKVITKPINYAILNQKDTLFSNESAPTFAELFEINDLKAQAQAKDTVILTLEEKLNSFNGDATERKVKRDVQEIETLNIELDHKEKVLVITALKEQLNKLKGKAVLTEAVSLNPIDPELLKVDVTPLVPKLRKNRTAHTNYIRHTQEEAASLRKIVESERLLSLLNTSLVYA